MFILIPLIVWAIAQVLKFTLQSRFSRKPQWAVLVGTGGMPSTHSALVTSLVTLLFLTEGYASPVSAVAFVFAVIVIYDAVTLRWVVQKQSIMLNYLRRGLSEDVQVLYPKLSESVGHRLREIFAGMLLGVVATILLFQIWR